MNFLKTAAVMFFFSFCALNVYAQKERRSFYIDAGAGFGAGGIYSFFNPLESEWKMEKSLSLYASAGWSPLLRFMFITAGFSYTQEVNSLGGNKIAVTLTNFSGGLKLYPFKSRKYFQFGLEAGPAFATWESNEQTAPAPVGAESGIVFTGVFAYDFSRRLGGPSLIAGSALSFTKFPQDQWLVNTNVFVKLALKGVLKKGAAELEGEDYGDMATAFPFTAVIAAAIACWAAYRASDPGDRSKAP
ncbi:MAG: hypothetical protein LBC53_08515 [Spirochaetaceae bacterium]|jgi:hypothetical protein|nr:hypothetical protein [Spirochaetaceae bacterium]